MATMLERLTTRTGEDDDAILEDCIESAKSAILSRRFPYGDYPTNEDGKTYIEERYVDLQYRIALDLYYRIGSEGQLSHSENGIRRSYESSWISEELLSEITPYCGVAK